MASDPGGLDSELRRKLAELSWDFEEWLRTSNKDEKLRSMGNTSRPRWTFPDLDGLRDYRDVVLLPELAAMEVNTGAKRPEPGGNLVLTAGMTPQPLLLSVAWWRPGRLLIAPSAGRESHLSPRRGSLHVAKWVADVVQESPLALGMTESPQVEILEEGLHPTDPASALGTLRSWLRELGVTDPAVTRLDITGGKKTMSATAFALASELGIQATYLDGTYSPVANIPRPGSMEVCKLPDPREALGLARAKEARDLYRHASFGAASQALRGAVEAMEQWGSPEDTRRYHRAALVAAACQLWASADYGGALSHFKEAGEKPPYAVKRLGATWGAWYRAEDPGGLAGALRGKHEELAIYLVDAWRHVERWHERQPRDAFLRWYGLGEYALEALLVKLRRAGNLKVDAGDAGLESRIKGSKLVHLLGGVGRMAELFRSGLLDCTWRPRGSGEDCLVEIRLSAPPTLDGLDFWLEEVNRNLRNACAHKLAMVSAEKALEASRASRSMILSCVAAFPGPGGLAGKTERWFGSSAFQPPDLGRILE